MHPMPHDVSPDDKVRANELNLQEFWRYIVTQCGGAMRDEPDLFLFATGIPIAFFNGVCHASFPADAADDRIEFVKGWLQRHSVPAHWVIGPSARPVDLGTHLLARGFAGPGGTPGMDLDLHMLTDAPPLPEGVVIERVRNRDHIRSWTETSLAGFGVPAESTESAFKVFARLDPDDEAHARCYLARLNGQPVGTSMLVFGGGVAGLYSISTLPHARNHSIGTALTLAPLWEARALGYGVAILQASAMGYPLYRRVGFVERMRYLIYRLPPD